MHGHRQECYHFTCVIDSREKEEASGKQITPFIPGVQFRLRDSKTSTSYRSIGKLSPVSGLGRDSQHAVPWNIT